MKKTLLLLGMILIAGCAIGRPTPIPDTGSPAVRLYVEKCSPCHSVPHPKRHTFAEWRHIIKLMDKRMKNKGMTFTANQKEIIMGYLKKNAR